MPYTLPWSGLTVPGNTTPAADIDVKLTNIPDALKERLEDVLIVDVTADPWVLQDDVKGVVTGKRLLIPHTQFRELDGGGGNAFSEAYTSYRKDSGKSVAAVMLPPGVTVTLVEFFLYGVSAGYNIEMYKYSAGTAAKTSIFSLAKAENNTFHAEDSGAQAILIDADQFYYIAIDSTGANTSDTAFRLVGARITYDCDAAIHTI